MLAGFVTERGEILNVVLENYYQNKNVMNSCDICAVRCLWCNSGDGSTSVGKISLDRVLLCWRNFTRPWCTLCPRASLFMVFVVKVHNRKNKFSILLYYRRHDIHKFCYTIDVMILIVIAYTRVTVTICGCTSHLRRRFLAYAS